MKENITLDQMKSELKNVRTAAAKNNESAISDAVLLHILSRIFPEGTKLNNLYSPEKIKRYESEVLLALSSTNDLNYNTLPRIFDDFHTFKNKEDREIVSTVYNDISAAENLFRQSSETINITGIEKNKIGFNIKGKDIEVDQKRMSDFFSTHLNQFVDKNYPVIEHILAKKAGIRYELGKITINNKDRNFVLNFKGIGDMQRALEFNAAINELSENPENLNKDYSSLQQNILNLITTYGIDSVQDLLPITQTQITKKAFILENNNEKNYFLYSDELKTPMFFSTNSKGIWSKAENIITIDANESRVLNRIKEYLEVDTDSIKEQMLKLVSSSVENAKTVGVEHIGSYFDNLVNLYHDKNFYQPGFNYNLLQFVVPKAAEDQDVTQVVAELYSEIQALGKGKTTGGNRNAIAFGNSLNKTALAKDFNYPFFKKDGYHSVIKQHPRESEKDNLKYKKIMDKNVQSLEGALKKAFKEWHLPINVKAINFKLGFQKVYDQIEAIFEKFNSNPPLYGILPGVVVTANDKINTDEFKEHLWVGSYGPVLKLDKGKFYVRLGEGQEVCLDSSEMKVTEAAKDLPEWYDAQEFKINDKIELKGSVADFEYPGEKGDQLKEGMKGDIVGYVYVVDFEYRVDKSGQRYTPKQEDEIGQLYVDAKDESQKEVQQKLLEQVLELRGKVSEFHGTFHEINKKDYFFLDKTTSEDNKYFMVSVLMNTPEKNYVINFMSTDKLDHPEHIFGDKPNCLFNQNMMVSRELTDDQKFTELVANSGADKIEMTCYVPKKKPIVYRYAKEPGK